MRARARRSSTIAATIRLPSTRSSALFCKKQPLAVDDFQSMDLFSDVSDTDILKNLLAELHDDLCGRLSRFGS
jgi:hypothetical protein